MKIEVENIKCGGCMNSIKTALLKEPTIESVEIDKETDTVHVEGVITYEALVNKLTGLGYPEKGANNLLHKAKSYVSCAVGRVQPEA